MPWVYLSPFFERYKDEYIHNLFRVSTHGDWDRWVEFCLRGTINQCRDAVRRCELLDHLRDVLHQKADGLSPRMRMLVDRLFVSPVVKVQDVKKWCGVSRPTARADVAKLEAIDVLKPLDKPKKPRIYYSPDILNIAYSEEDEA